MKVTVAMHLPEVHSTVQRLNRAGEIESDSEPDFRILVPFRTFRTMNLTSLFKSAPGQLTH